MVVFSLRKHFSGAKTWLIGLWDSLRVHDLHYSPTLYRIAFAPSINQFDWSKIDKAQNVI
jgi:hypothetical protein